MKQNYRLRELDFLRGIAIILVLLRHQQLFDFTTKMGWIGVDLFFVLSGFLVSGLLFKEYLKFGNIKPGLFLIRRGFKIYPIYYLTYFLYLIPKIIKHQFEWSGFLSDLFFVQNYVYAWGYAYIPSWSLAVEEHFYFSFAILLWLGIKYTWIDLKADIKISRFEIWIFVFMISCLIGRIISNIYFQGNGDKNFTMSHLRVDSLLAGAFISYLYYFKKETLILFFESHKGGLIILSFALLSFTPFIDFKDSFFVRTFGFTFLYISFAILLVYFLINDKINKELDSLFSKRLVDIISKIGFSSYGIYIIHGFVNFIFALLNNFFLHKLLNQTILFFITSVTSVLSGMFMTFYVEKYFLNSREKYFPNRIN